MGSRIYLRYIACKWRRTKMAIPGPAKKNYASPLHLRSSSIQPNQAIGTTLEVVHSSAGGTGRKPPVSADLRLETNQRASSEDTLTFVILPGTARQNSNFDHFTTPPPPYSIPAIRTAWLLHPSMNGPRLSPRVVLDLKEAGPPPLPQLKHTHKRFANFLLQASRIRRKGHTQGVYPSPKSEPHAHPLAEPRPTK
ncbi:unnamed protein product [Ectocarpus fasciculatus]